jgi:hypothetical protein
MRSLTDNNVGGPACQAASPTANRCSLGAQGSAVYKNHSDGGGERRGAERSWYVNSESAVVLVDSPLHARCRSPAGHALPVRG